MSREDIIRMARDAGITRCNCKSSTCDMLHSAATFSHLEKFAAIVADAERDVILQILRNEWFKTQADLEAAIQARGQQ